MGNYVVRDGVQIPVDGIPPENAYILSGGNQSVTALKADRIISNPASLALFVMNFEDIYEINLSNEEANQLLGQISMGWIPAFDIFMKAVVLLEERF